MVGRLPPRGKLSAARRRLMRAGLAVIARERADEGKAAGDLPCAPSDLIQRLDAMGVHPLADLVRDAGAGLRVQEVRGADQIGRAHV